MVLNFRKKNKNKRFAQLVFSLFIYSKLEKQKKIILVKFRIKKQFIIFFDKFIFPNKRSM